MAFRTPEAKTYSFPRGRKFFHGKHVQPFIMKSEGTSAMGRQHKMPPAPFSGLNSTKARRMREDPGPGYIFKASQIKGDILAVLVDEAMRLMGIKSPSREVREYHKQRLDGHAAKLMLEGYRVERGQLIKKEV